MTISDVVTPFIEALNRDQIRLRPPRPFIFFCGGQIQKTLTKRPESLRDYLLRELNSNPLPQASIVCAESATNLFRDSQYSDLIAFEADIAQISDIVLVIGESAGSLTELGAFSINAAIAPRLKIFVSDAHYNQDSFIRLGPLRHLETTISENSVSSYPWRVNRAGILVKSSATPHLKSMRLELVKRLAEVPQAEKFQHNNRRHIMILIYWIIQLLRAAVLNEIADVLAKFGIQEKPNDIKRFLYCMRVAEWIDERKYGNPVYYYCKIDRDPMTYAFRDDVPKKDTVRWRSDIAAELKRRKITRPKPVLELIGKQ